MPAQKSIVTDPIELKTAQEYFSNFENNNYVKLFNNTTGGIFKATRPKVWCGEEDFKGIFFWFCLEAGQISLAIENKKGFDYDDTDIDAYKPIDGSEIIETTNFIYSSGGKSWNPFLTVAEFKLDALLSIGKDEESNAGQVIPKVANFLSLVQGKELCKVAFAYMSDQDGKELGQSYLSTFLEREDLEYISYHFGYHLADKPQGLRLVLIGRDKNGNPLQNPDESKSYKFEILNGSRPPRKPPTK